ncbi:PREDICTED: uncharacterized protein LOC109325701 [Lupinus angustifolius]|uniref:uncharacterized protein LOC109325701 n=1 Tax=Lupinus angustifolius TaxID=3871 RepID=UPI00092F582A|nr:PREDICTED: uncharacterized protein LOC109325701 [Lupinus angustifolius]
METTRAIISDLGDESFFGIVHVKDTTSLSLKMAIDDLFCKHGLSVSRIGGQGYGGASNMQGEFCGLKSLILRENPSAFYLKELYDRFSETNIRLLLRMYCLSPANLFSNFDKAKLIEFANFYPHDFCSTNFVMLDNQLETYIIDVRSSAKFASLQGINNLSQKLVENGRHII